MKGVLLLAHGTPDSLDQMEEFLTRVRGGRAPSKELVEEMRQNYGAIGGRSPLTDITRAQAECLRLALGGSIPVYVGMRSWSPFIADALAQARGEGVTDIVAIPLAPQYSRLSIGKYKEAVEKERGLRTRFVDSWHDQPHLLDAFAGKVRLALGKSHPDEIVFTAHSLPTKVIQEGDPYADQVAATARGVASRVGLAEYQSAYQSAGRTPEPWLAPTLEECLSGVALSGKKSVLVVPVGFVSDHTEILFDIDVKAAQFARERGLQLARTESLNTDPLLVQALVELAS